MIPPWRRRASKFTIVGTFVVDRQCGKIHAFRYLEYRAAWKSGLGSTKRPDHWKVKQKRKINIDYIQDMDFQLHGLWKV